MEYRLDGRAIAILGGALLVVGIIIYLLPVTLNHLIDIHSNSPYELSGAVLIVSGIIAIVGGGFVLTDADRSSIQEQQQIPSIVQQPQYSKVEQDSVSPNLSMKFCRHCGKTIKGDSVFCEHCGKAL